VNAVHTIGAVSYGAKDIEASNQLVNEIRTFGETNRPKMAGKVFTTYSPKGGEGKSTVSKEECTIFGGVLADLDWDGGRVSIRLGHVPAKDRVSRLLTAIRDEDMKLPKLFKLKGRPPLIPGDEDFEANQPDADRMAEIMLSWADQLKSQEGDEQASLWGDCHPGGSPSSLGAAAAADLILMPVTLGIFELNAVAAALRELDGYNILLVLNKMPVSPPARLSRRLLDLARDHDVPIAENSIRDYPWMREKQRPIICSAPYLGVEARKAAREYLKLAKEIADRV